MPKTKSKTLIRRAQKHDAVYKDVLKNLNSLLKVPLSRNVEFSEVVDTDTLEIPSTLEEYELNYQNRTFMNRIENEMRNVTEGRIISEYEATKISIDVIDTLKYVLRKDCNFEGQWTVYGSYYSGLCDGDSDIDLSFELNTSSLSYEPDDILMDISETLKEYKDFSDVKYISCTRVPLVKFFHEDTEKEVNITLSNNLGIATSQCIRQFLNCNSKLKVLTIYLKCLLDAYHLMGTGKITTHILFWLVVFFMQQKKLLPTVTVVRKGLYYTSHISNSLFSLFLDFAEFYKNFDFLKFALNPEEGEIIPIEEFDRERFLKRYFINLIHPLDDECNLTNQVDVSLVNKFKIFCYCMSEELLNFIYSDEDPNECYYRYIPLVLPYEVNQPDDLVQYVSVRLDMTTYLPNDGTLDSDYVFEAVHKLMENVFDFQADCMFEQDIDFTFRHVGDIEAPTLYMSYHSTEYTWENEYISKIFPTPEYDEDGEPERQLNIFLICEVCKEVKEAKLMIQTDAHFVPFLKSYAQTLLLTILKKQILD